MMLQLNPPLPLLSPLGKCLAHALIDYGIEESLYFVCFQDSTGECWIWPNKEIKAQENISYGRKTHMGKKESQEKI